MPLWPRHRATAPTWIVPCCAVFAGMVMALTVVAPASGQVLAGFKPRSLAHAPPGFHLTPRHARAIADRQPAVLRERARDPRLRGVLLVPQYFGDHRYEVTYLVGKEVRVDVHINGETGKAMEVWTGPQADTLLARGYSPSIGRSLNSPFIWLPLALLFLAPFVDPRRPRRLIHLDLLVLLGFGVSQLYFNRGEVDVSVPLVYPLLVYLLVRLLCAGFKPRATPVRLLPTVRIAWLVVGLVLLMGFRIGLNVVDSHTIDVGQESVFGADRILRGEPLYNSGGGHGDTYGPLAYLAYVPFVAVFPADGPSGYDRAARAAAISFDLLVIAGLLLLGMRMRAGPEGRVLGVALAYAWAAYPFSLYALQANTNDALIAALVVFALLAVDSPPGRGVLIGLAGAAKFVPLALAPLLARGRGANGWREVVPFAALVLAVLAAAVFGFLPDGGLRELYDATIGFQLGRESPFSLWGLHPSLGGVQVAVEIAAAAFALLLAVTPRERSVRQLAALSAAVLIATQLAATYWFYTYLTWFTPVALAAIFSAYALGPAQRAVVLETDPDAARPLVAMSGTSP